MNHLKLVSSVFAIALSLVACGDDTDGPGEPAPEPEEGAVFVTFNNLPELGEGFVYEGWLVIDGEVTSVCLLYTSPSPRDATLSRMPSSA